MKLGRSLNVCENSLDARTNRTVLIRVLMSFSRAALAAQDYVGMSEFAGQAYELSKSIGDLEGEALSIHNIANGLVYTFQVSKTRSAYTKTLTLYERLSHQIGLASVYVDYGLFHTELGLLDDAAPMYERGLTIAEAIDLRFVTCVGNVNLAYCERLRGNFVDAKLAATRAMQAAAMLTSAHLMAAALGVLGAAETELAETESAIAHLQEGVELRRSDEPSPRLGDNLSALATAHLRAGNTQAAHSVAAELIALYELSPHLAPQPTQWLGTAAQVYAATGNEQKTRELRRKAAGALKARAALIPDDATRDAFLNLPFNRALRTRY